MRISTILASVSSVIILAGCAAPPPMNFTPHDVVYSTQRINAELKSINVSFPSDDKGKMRVLNALNNYQSGSTSLDFRTNFKVSLEEALNLSGIFTDDAKTKINIYAQLVDLDVPSMGLSFPTTSTVIYKIQRRSDGKVLYEKEIKAVGESAINDLMGVNRSLSALNVSYQNNIKAFIADLEAEAQSQSNPFK